METWTQHPGLLLARWTTGIIHLASTRLGTGPHSCFADEAPECRGWHRCLMCFKKDSQPAVRRDSRSSSVKVSFNFGVK
ncbi:Hypothetical predicted protein, partial [Marmota monax]